MKRALFFISGLAAFAVLVLGGRLLWAMAEAGAGYKAKILCSSVFVSGRRAEQVLAEDLSVDGYGLLRVFSHEIDQTARRVQSSLAGLFAQQATFRQGFGCALDRGGRRSGWSVSSPAGTDAPANSEPWPQTAVGPLEGVDAPALKSAVAAAFAEPDDRRLRRTRALVVLHKGRIVAERYGEGITASTPLLGWSMAKSVLAMMVGALVERGLVATENDALHSSWRHAGDQRSAITLDQLLRMTSGLSFGEVYSDETSDVVTMLFANPDASAFAANKPLAHAPGSHWHYSSGSANIAAAALRRAVEGRLNYAELPRELLFRPLGMTSAVMEMDAAGTLIASSFMYANARDWARLGLLLLNDGIWRGTRILAPGWRDYMLKPAAHAPDQRFGAMLWLKLPRSDQLGEPPLPEDAYYMLGHEKQIVAVVPSRDLVIVRLGLTRVEGAWDHARDLAPIVAAFEASERQTGR